MSYKTRVMSAAELDLAVEWAASEGWNPGLNDALAFRVADPAGFLVGLKDGVPVASISVVRYGADFGFLGFYIATLEARGQGLGYRLWQAGMAHLAGRNVGLDGVPAQQANYRKSGFTLAWRNVRFGGVPQPGKSAAPGVTLVDARTLPFTALAQYDRRFFPAPRDAFLAAWIGTQGHHGLAALRNGDVVGLGIVRPCREGHKIGPLYAESRDVAGALFQGLCAARSADGPVFLDVPEPNAAAVALAEGAGLKPAFETARMYTGPAPAIDRTGLYGVTTFELG
ncbi:GNAT family N-acetyltransferase [Desertibaculum subflavum]|uniref:GNAT family N-acetyltransferase n=1 Tax=Desertibaculum subflavum TaxID=2268458 RepID=UPI000E66455F